ncbi:MAG: HAD-IIA family hydrolase [Anaerolineales bacterium]
MASSPAQLLANLHGLILDMDGVLWEGDRPLPGMPEFLSFLRAEEIRIILATNNASLTPESYVQKLARMGAEVRRKEIVTSATATAEYLKSIARPGEKIFIIGEEGLTRAIKEAGLKMAEPGELHPAYVVCGMDRGLTWQKLANATIYLRGGARFIGTNPDLTFPTERGIAHGNGAVLAALTAASGVKPTIIGKPFPSLFQTAIRKMGIPKARVAALGDRLETDILGARKVGIRSILVLTGISSRKELRYSKIKPTLVVKDLPSLQREWLLSKRPRNG